jgi:hypothetical protein
LTHLTPDQTLRTPSPPFLSLLVEHLGLSQTNPIEH